MTEKNSKHLITMSFDGYNFYIKNYKIFRTAKVSQIPAFNNAQEFCYMGYGNEQIKVTALIDKNRINEIYFMLNNFKLPNSKSVEIDGIDVGKYVVTSYEICGSEENYIYEVVMTLCNTQQ